MVLLLPLMEVCVATYMDLASAILKTVEFGVVEGGGLGSPDATACPELSGAGERGTVRGGLHLAALVTEVAHVDGEASGAEKSDHADGGEDEAVAGLAIGFFCGGGSHCGISRTIRKANDLGRRRCGECALTLRR